MITFDAPKDFDLLMLQNGNTAELLSTTEVPGIDRHARPARHALITTGVMISNDETQIVDFRVPTT